MVTLFSYISGIAILGLPAEMYVYGTQLWSVVIADACVSLTMAIVYLPVFYRLQITSSYEVYNLKLFHFAHSHILSFTRVIYICFMQLYMNEINGNNLREDEKNYYYKDRYHNNDLIRLINNMLLLFSIWR